MKKTVSITLSGIIFNIEEDGFAQLKTYLDSIRDYFASYEDHQEIMQDIEARVAEKFSEKTSPAKQAISLADVEELISAMGTIEDIAENEAEPSSAEAPKKISWREKKLYRDPDNAIIMGVASGIAAYFGIDPVLVRLAFAATLFFGGAGVIIYLILCLIVPEAKTTAQKMQMHGQPVNLSNLKEAAEEKISMTKKKLSDPRPLRKLVMALEILVRKLAKIFSWLIGLGLIVASMMFFLGILFVYGNLIFNANSPYVDFPIKDLFTGLGYYFFISAGFLVAFIPTLIGLFFGISLLKRKLILSLASGLVLLVIWMMSLTAVGVYTIRIAPVYNEKMQAMENQERVTQNFDFRDFNSIEVAGNQKVTVVRADNFNIQATGRQSDLDATKIELEGQTLKIDEHHDNKICIFCFDQRHTPELLISMPNLTSYQVVGSARTEIQNFEAENMKLDLYGFNKTTADVKVNNLAVKMTGDSRVTLKGAANNLNVQSDGYAKLYAINLEAQNVKLKMIGSGQTQVWAKQKLDVIGQGFGHVYYKGEPQISKKVDDELEIDKYQEPFLED